VRPLAEKILHPINEGSQPAESQTLQQFIEGSYLPQAKGRKRPSTYRGYVNLYSAQIKSRIGGMKLATFRTVDGQPLLDKIETETELSQSSLTHIKNLLSAIFRSAKRVGAIDANPIADTEIPKGKANGKTHAYSREEIETMLAALKGVAHVAVTVAACTALPLAELRGLQWQDNRRESVDRPTNVLASN
jgi:integrase